MWPCLIVCVGMSRITLCLCWRIGREDGSSVCDWLTTGCIAVVLVAHPQGLGRRSHQLQADPGVSAVCCHLGGIWCTRQVPDAAKHSPAVAAAWRYWRGIAVGAVEGFDAVAAAAAGGRCIRFCCLFPPLRHTHCTNLLRMGWGLAAASSAQGLT